MKIPRIISLSALGVFLIVSVCSAWTIDNGINNGYGSGTTAVDPSASPAAGAYTSSQSVSLSASGSNSIRYTIDGTTPSCTSGTVYSSAITVNSNLTIKAISCYVDNGGTSTSNISSHAYTFSCSTSSVANGSISAYPSCTITCNSGYTLSGSSCVRQSSSSGGGGGGSAITYCSAVTFGAWQNTCFNGTQFRNALAQTPVGCTLTAAQQAEQQRVCSVATSTPNTNATTPPANPPAPGNAVLENIATESQIVSTNNTDTLLNHLGNSADTGQEQSGLTKYKTILGLDKKISSEEKLTINDFIVYGTRSTQRLGAGERAAVINSYYNAYGKLPNSEAEWSDVLKIASGRWPSERSATAEAQAKIEFKKVYARNAVMTNNIDENAIMVIAYGLLPLNRNLKSEQTAIKTFRWVYGHAPVNALAWNIVRAIAYSGATR